jgi:hypothetical protein
VVRVTELLLRWLHCYSFCCSLGSRDGCSWDCSRVTVIFPDWLMLDEEEGGLIPDGLERNIWNSGVMLLMISC